MSKVEFLLLFLFICLIPSQLSTHYWPPGLNFPRLDYLSFSIYLTDLIALSILLLRLLTGRLLLCQRPCLRSRPFKVLVVLLLINISFSLYPLFTTFKWLQLLLYVLLFSEYDWSTKLNRRLIIVSLSFSLLWTSFLAVAQTLLSHSVGGILYWLGERPLTLNSSAIAKVDLWDFGPTLRAYSTFPHPNALAGFILVSLSLVRVLNRAASVIHPKQVHVLVTISLLGLASTFSLSAFLVVGLSVLLNATSHKYSILNQVKISFVLISLALVFAYTTRPVSVLDRLDQLPHALINIARHPLTGTGFGAYVLGITSPITRFGYLYQPVHNIFLLLLAEIGLGGTISLFLLIKKNVTLTTNFLSNPTLLPLYLIATLGLFDHYWLTSHSNLILVVLLFILNTQKNVRFKST